MQKFPNASSLKLACYQPANPDEISRVEQKLGCKFPRELKELLLETNGIADKYGDWLMFPTDMIESCNLNYWNDAELAQLYMSFASLLIFGDEANGDLFAYGICKAGDADDWKIFRWDHETDSRFCFAYSLQEYAMKRLGEEES